MSTSEAKEAVGRAMHKRLTGATLDAWWDNKTPEQRAPYIEDGMHIVAAYLREALRPRLMSEAPRLGDEGSDFVLICRDGGKRPFVGYAYKSRVFCMCPGTLPVDVGHVDDFAGWLPLPELPG